jgi:1-acylglycerone phosphate reductase
VVLINIGIYGGSKAALEIIADTLRLELKPFGVGVLNIVTGAVESNGYTHAGHLELPKDSLYKSIENEIRAASKWEDGVKRMKLEKYAESVVDKICHDSTGKLWKGSMASTLKFILTFMPQSLLVSLLILFLMLTDYEGLCVCAGQWNCNHDQECTQKGCIV